MKRISLLLAAFIGLSSCENTWDSEARELFHQGCMESARENNMNETAAQSMCDCRLEKAMKKYPSFSEAMEHADKLMDDPEIRACR